MPAKPSAVFRVLLGPPGIPTVGFVGREAASMSAGRLALFTRWLPQKEPAPTDAPSLVQEFELYVPLCDNAGGPVAASLVESLKDRLRQRFGGFTYFPQETQGEWETGGHRFRDRIVIFRVLTADSGATQWFQAILPQLTDEFRQADFLITAKPVEIIQDAQK